MVSPIQRSDDQWRGTGLARTVFGLTDQTMSDDAAWAVKKRLQNQYNFREKKGV